MRATTALLGLALDAAADAVTASQAVVDHLAREEHALAAVYLERAGRLRRVAHRGEGQLRDGLPLGGELLGRAGVARGGHTARVPITMHDRTIGALHVASTEALDVEPLRAYATALGERLAALGGLAAPTPAQRLLQHVATLASLDDPEAIAEALGAAALDLVPLDSFVLVRTTAAASSPSHASGPLAGDLAAAHRHLAALPGDATSWLTAGAGPAPLPGARTLTVVALNAHGERLGVFALAGGEPAELGPEDTDLLEQLATHAALALHTAERLSALREQAATDPLTGLGHHATFHEALATSHRRPRTAVVLCDLDGFKRINDTHGHAHGDRVLCGVVDAMSGALRRGDRLFRIGGDEFAALLAVASEDEALDAATRLRAAVVEAALDVTISVGVAVPHDGEPDDELLARADQALYSVKADGRDGVALARAGR